MAKKTKATLTKQSQNACVNPENMISITIEDQSGIETEEVYTAMSKLVTVIMPSFNVEAYIAEAIESVRQQTCSDFQLIVVDDGSEDATVQIVEQYLAQDERISLIRLNHLGPGAARNAALRLAKSKFLSYVDADDVLEPIFLERMVNAIERNGTDLAVCNVWRLRNGRYYEAELFQKAIFNSDDVTNIRQHPELIWDTVVWNKVYRLDFYLEKVGFFPEGILYEDMLPASLAHVRAASITILDERLYAWRVRSERNSITQNKADAVNFRDRISVSQGIVELYRAEIPELLANVFEKILLNDLLMYIPLILDASDSFREVAVVQLSRFLRQVPESVYSKLDAGVRLLYRLLERGRVNDLKLALDENGKPRTRYTLRVEGSRYYAMLPFLDGWNALPKDIFDVTNTIRLRAGVLTIEPDEFGFSITGYAYIENFELETDRSSNIDVFLMRGNRKIPLRSERRLASFSRLPDAADHTGYERAGFTARIDYVDLLQGGTMSGDWLIGVNVQSGRIQRQGTLVSELPETTVTAMRATNQGGVWFKHVMRGQNLLLNITPGTLVASGINCDESGAIWIDMASSNVAVSKIEMRLPSGEVVQQLEPVSIQPGALRFSITPDLVDLAFAAHGATAVDLVATDDGGKDHRIKRSSRDDLPVHTTQSGRVAQVCESPYGNVFLRLKSHIVRVDQLSVIETGWLHLSGYASFRNAKDWYLALSHEETDLEFRFKSICVAGKLRSSIDVFSVMRTLGVLGPLPIGGFTVIANVGGQQTVVELGEDVQAPQTFVYKNLQVSCQPKQNARGGFINVAVESRLPDNARGPKAQDKLRTSVYAPALSRGTIPLFLCDSFSGKQIDCNPYGLWEAAKKQGLDQSFVFTTANGSVIVPPGVNTVVKWTSEYWDLLGRSKFVVTNDWMPAAFQRRNGQHVVQTWHGTPLKRIGLDIEAPAFDPELHKKVRAESRKWDFLISQNSFSTERFRKAFDFSRPILETGYPRNDSLFLGQRDTIRSRIRQQIGAKDDEIVVLYAPTWRDDQRIGVGAFLLRQMLDLDQLLRILPNVHVLARWHHLTVPEMRFAGNPRVTDVSSYPFTSHLFLAADALISDYSSITVDFSLTRKPVLFFTPDLERYADRLRGFYIDYKNDVPGPILRKSEDVIGALRDLDTIRKDYEDKYSNWVSRFGHLDDGHAGERLLGMLLGIS